MSFTLPPLPYAYNALEPYIDEKTMQVHHDLHHGTYVNKLNTALENNPELTTLDIEVLLSEIKNIPEQIRQAIINHGGGHANHSLFWQIMGTPTAQKEPSGALLESINKTFGSFNDFKLKFTEAAATKFGSGWAWLALDTNKKLILTSTSNQDSLYSEHCIPILTLDVWEHAYYLKYQNRRPEYIDAWWNVVNWKKVEELFEKNK